MTTGSSADTKRIFCIFALEDSEMLGTLERHLKPFERRGDLRLSHAKRVLGGDEWDVVLRSESHEAHFTLLLVSSHFLANDDCYSQTTRALERHHSGQARVVSILLQPCLWEHEAFASLNVIPRSREPLRSPDNHEAWSIAIHELLSIFQGGTMAYAPALADEAQWHEYQLQLAAASRSLGAWPQTLPGGEWLEQGAFDKILVHLKQEQPEPMIVLGAPGSGKSALLARLMAELQSREIPVLSIRADQLLQNVDSIDELQRWLEFTSSPIDIMLAAAERGRAVVIIDQLDALCTLVDLHTQRLDMLLKFVGKLNRIRNIAVILSCREFEYRYDTRFLSLKAEKLELPPLAIGDVERVLRENGVEPKELRARFVDALRLPPHLKIFLTVVVGKKPIPVFDSYQQMLHELWQQRVIRRDGDSSRASVVRAVAQYMADHEELSAPVARFDASRQAIDSLVAADVLRLDGDSRRIAFTHQTWFSFARAHTFIAGEERLSGYVRAHENSLFVRQTLWGALVNMRGAAKALYRDELFALWNAKDLRTHVRALLLEFIGQLDDPDDDEARVLLPVLEEQGYLRRVALGALAGSRGWFERIRRNHLPRLMTGPHAGETWGTLAYAWTFARDQVLDLLEQYWVHNLDRRALVFGVMRSLKEWDRRAVDIVASIIAADNADALPRHEVNLVVNTITEQAPLLALPIVRLVFDRERQRCDQEASNYQRSRLCDPYERLLNGNHGMYRLIELARKVPEPFVNAMWTWFVSILDVLLDRTYRRALSYYESGGVQRLQKGQMGPVRDFVEAIGIAIEGYATQNACGFITFAIQWSSHESITVHRYLVDGYKQIARHYPGAALEYLLGDSRRFLIDDFDGRAGGSCALLELIAPHIDSTEAQLLENAIAHSRRYEEDKLSDDNARWRFRARRYNRLHRLRLLQALELSPHLSAQTRALIEQDCRALADLHDDYPRIVGFHKTESPMSAEQMQKAKDEQILHLFDELVDSTEWEHPSRWLAGGSIEASREVAKIAALDPERAIRLLDHFSPATQQRPVAHILSGIAEAKPPWSTEQFEDLVQRLETRGFNSDEYRHDVAWALRKVAVARGLSDRTCTLLEQWLKDVSDEPESIRRVPNQAEPKARSILWATGGAHVFPGGNFPVLYALFFAYMHRKPPTIDALTKVLETHLLHRVERPDVWRSMLYPLGHIRGDMIENLLDNIFTRHPSARDSIEGAHAMGHVAERAAGNLLRTWGHSLRDGDWHEGPQAYGELLVFVAARRPDLLWAHEELQAALSAPCEVERATAIRLGLAFTAVNIWTEPGARALSTEVLLKLIPHARGELAETLMHIFPYRHSLIVDDATIRVLDALRQHRSLLVEVRAENLTYSLKDLAAAEPELVNELCNALLDENTKIPEGWHRLARAGEHLIQIAVTLHRLRDYRKVGLDLFERLLEMEIYGISEVLRDVDVRPSRMVI